MRPYTLLIFALILWGCASSSPKPQAASALRKQPAAHHLEITSSTVSDTIEWGLPYELPVEIHWVSGSRMSVHLAPAADTPPWLKVEIQPAVVDTTAQVIVRLTPQSSQTPVSQFSFVMVATSDSLPMPVQAQFSFIIRPQTGDFTRLRFDTASRACDSVCAKVSPDGQVAFYDLRQGGSCNDTAAAPEARISYQGIALSRKGFAFGSTCKVAAVYEASGMLSFVNLGIYPRIPAGGILLSVRGAQDCWISPDNTIAVIAIGEAIMPYDIGTGRLLGNPCRLSSDTVSVHFYGSSIIRAGLCKWVLQ
jgi:hypothetical protein